MRPFAIPLLVLILVAAVPGRFVRASADPLAELLDSGALSKAYNSVLLGYLLREGRTALPDEIRTRAVQQLVTGLEQELAERRYEYYSVTTDDLDDVDTLVTAGYREEATAFLEDCVS